MSESTGHTGTTPATDYVEMVLPQVPRLLSALDREPLSRTYGSFDRDHWAWKFRDFPLGMLQVATYPLALLWADRIPGSPYYRKDRLLTWIEGALHQTVSRQKSNGSFDAFAPNENDPGPTLGVVHGLLETVRVLGDAVSPAVRGKLQEAVARACGFALHREEQHAFISNHRALFAVAFLGAADLTGDSRFRRRADSLIESILDRQASSGWYAEYGGPDPGYESLGIFHLAMYWRRTSSAALLDSLRRSIDFYSHVVHPDGSVGGVYGSRRTRLYFPGGFEILSAEIPAAKAVSEFMRSNLTRGNVVTPANADLENLPPLLYTYLEAFRTTGTGPDVSKPELPCHSLAGERWFEDAGLLTVGRPSYYAVLNGRRGGVIRVHDRRTGRIAYEDAGYLVKVGKNAWTSEIEADDSQVALASDSIRCRTPLSEVSQPLLTPGLFLVLRALNLTLFRSSRLGALIRRMIVSRMITARTAGPFDLNREIHFGPTAVRFADELKAVSRYKVDEVVLSREFTGIHMGSAKYFHPSDLEMTPAPDLGYSMAEGLTERGRAKIVFTLSFRDDQPATLQLEGQH